MNNLKKQIYVFCDFDGTITLKDIGDELFIQYGGIEPYNSQLKNREINIHQYWNILCEGLPADFNKNNILEFVEDIQIDAYFQPFVKFCEDNSIKLKIVSDGFADYIKPILAKFNLEYLDLSSNYFDYTDGIKPIFPGSSESCNCFSASCKRNSVLKNLSDEDFVVYIGDGYSDFCPAEHSDIIFAKKNLARYCTGNKIPHYHFSSFFDIIKIFKETIMTKGKLKHRRQAELKRKEAYYIE